MPRYEQRDKDGTLIETYVVTDETLKADPDALLTHRAAKGSKAGPAPEGYDHVASVDGDPDALITDCTVHIYAKKKAYEKEKPSKLAGLKAVVAEAEAKAENAEVPAK